ncbi:MAG: MBL fold metallo-hydrolase, partial [Bacteroidia bacterium]
MIRIDAKFSFYKAGQGSFYGGRILHQEINKVFTIVYDCGTNTFITGNSKSLNNEITYFKHHPHYFPHNDEIELLFISHLDYDHVSGLKRLLKEFKVKNIILPYIEKQYRQFFLVSFSENNDPNNDLSLDDYTSFIESPNTFIQNNSTDTQIYFVKSSSETTYQNYDENQLDLNNAYARGTQPNVNPEELNSEPNVSVYENNLQFFIRKDWEFTTYAKSVSAEAIKKLHTSLQKILKKKSNYNLSLEDLKNIVTTKRIEAHKCYTKCIGEINSHGLVLLHGPIGFKRLHGITSSNCELNHCNHCDEYRFDNKNRMLGTLLLGDVSINPKNNPIDLPVAFIKKLDNVHVVQVPHHGSSKNWDFTKFNALKIGANINRWENRILTVCNFGYGNKYGHPSHEVINNLRSIIFLNTQFSRLN